MNPYHTKYELYWMSPSGTQTLRGGANTIDGIAKICKGQIKDLDENPWETDDRKRLFLTNMVVYDVINDEVVDFPEEFFDDPYVVDIFNKYGVEY